MKQKTIQEQYILLKEGKIANTDFLNSVKRQFPQLIPSGTKIKDAQIILKNHKIINEGYIDIQPSTNYESRVKESWENKFKKFLTEEEVKANSTKVSKQVEDIQDNNWDAKDKKNPNNISAQQFLLGCYAEGKLEKNEEKSLEELQDIVKKNLAKDPLYYIKNYLHGVEGLGMTEMNTPVEPKGTHKSSGYGDLDKDTKALIKENKFNLNQGLMKLITEGLGDGDVKRKTYELDITSIESFKKMLAQYFPDKFEYDLDYYINWFNKEIRPNLNEDNDEEDGSFVDDKLLRDIDNKVKLINSLIEKAVDEDGDPIPVVDTTGTWESPTVYSPIHFDGKKLTIISKEVMGGKEEVDEYEGENLYHDGIPSLNYIGRMYRKALKKHNISEGRFGEKPKSSLSREEHVEFAKVCLDKGMDNDDIEEEMRYTFKNISQSDIEYAIDKAFLLDNPYGVLNENQPQESGLIVKVDSQDINSFENWLDQSPFYAEKESDGVYFFEEAPENLDNLEKFLQMEMGAEDISVQFEGQGDNLNEGLFGKEKEYKDGEIQKMKTQGFLSKAIMGSKGQLSNKIVNPPTQFIEDLVEYSKRCGYTFWTGDPEKKDDPYVGHFWNKYRTIYCCTEQSRKDSFAVWVYENNDLFFNRKGYDAKTNKWIFDNAPKNLQEVEERFIPHVQLHENIEEGDEVIYDGEKYKIEKISDDGRVYIYPSEESKLLGRLPSVWVYPEDLEIKGSLHENKNMNLQQKLKEIEKAGITASLEAKRNAIQEEIDSRQEKINNISENEALADFVDKNQIKVIEKEIKELEKHKNKLEGALVKANGGKKVKQVVKDEEQDDNTIEESDYAYDDERYWDEKDDEAYAAAYDAMDDETPETDYDSEDYDEDEWADENEYKGGEHDFKNYPINESYTTSDKIDFLSNIRYPEENHKVEFENMEMLSPKTINNLFESYFPEHSKKQLLKG